MYGFSVKVPAVVVGAVLAEGLPMIRGDDDDGIRPLGAAGEERQEFADLVVQGCKTVIVSIDEGLSLLIREGT